MNYTISVKIEQRSCDGCFEVFQYITCFDPIVVKKLRFLGGPYKTERGAIRAALKNFDADVVDTEVKYVEVTGEKKKTRRDLISEIVYAIDDSNRNEAVEKIMQIINGKH